jgi:hypothetical protein
MEYHPKLCKNLIELVDKGNVPHIIFYGPDGSGKRTILNFLLKYIYKDVLEYEKYLMYINCAQGKGIRFIRNELKFFAKTNINNNNGKLFKSIVLYSADKLTTDAQSALRRCIEQFSHTTRFFIITDENQKLLKPILSRFCNIYIPLPIINKKQVCLHNCYKDTKKNPWLIKNIENKENYKTPQTVVSFVNKLYDRAVTGVGIMNVIENIKTINEKKKFMLLSFFDEIRKEFRNEKLFMLFILINTFMRKEITLENIQEM